MNILISSAGRRVMLVKEFRKALKRLKVSGKVVAIDISHTSPALYAADSAHIVPRVNSPDFKPALFRICEQEQIHLIVPTIDPELPVYAGLKEKIESETGARVAVSSPDVIEICNNKYAFFHFLKSIGISTPVTYSSEEIETLNPPFPLFAKPRSGFASVNTYTVEDRAELQFLVKRFPDLIFQEYKRGREYTIDLLSDFQGQVLTIVPRERIEVRAGEVTRSRTEKHMGIIHNSRIIAEKLGSTGPITLQCLLCGDVPFFFEVNPRVGGGLPASIAAGANTPRRLIEMCLGKKLSPAIGRFRNNHYMLRYDDAIYRSTLLPDGIDIWRMR